MHSRYLNLDELVVEDIIWVDEVSALRNATCHIEGSKVVGLDCEWKPNYIKGSKPNKVLITDFSVSLLYLLLFFSLLIVLDFLIVMSCLAFIFSQPLNLYISTLSSLFGQNEAI